MAVSKLTEILRLELEEAFNRQESEGIIPPSVEFDELLYSVLGTSPTKRERALAFYQLLVLKSLDIIQINQEKPYDEIIITRGERWNIKLFAESMAF
jgi:chromatin segregation and condensation protein Rec8/ScpA/Scc1 (kleisin family)